ncbi:uncharacterized protein LOC119300491 [Triticum dicoccoides]|uniref:uncharacterized protein LOC119300491 n=1 Tax=Triticum dicoccoides TaxID=85692 RepID=UPI00188F500F|nr:uncharacterized protein LOC119300491 [Triticum dicoccoides]
MEDAAHRHGGRPKLGPGGGGADLISALPEDLLLLVLVRLRCARAAARTSLLARRWRGLWTRLPDLVFRDVAADPLLPALTSLQAAAGLGPGVSLLDIRVAGDDLGRGHSHRISSLLDAAARLSPVEFHFALPRDMLVTDVELPRFDIDLADFVLRCPRLRVLRVANDCYHSAGDITIKSESLEELQVRSRSKWTRCIDVEAPMLKQLTVAFHTINELRVSIVAPTVKKVSLECYYTIETEEISCWGLSMMTLHTGTAETEGQRLLTETGTEDDARLPLSNVYVLSLHLSGSPGWTAKPDAELEVAQKIEALLVTGFSVLELHFSTTEFHFGIPAKHAFGACVVRLLGMHRIRTATRKLRIVLLRSDVVKECPVNCRCDKPKNWRSKNISLINLEEVEIKGFEGEDHDFDFLKVIFRCAPMLKRMSVWMCDEVSTSNDRCLRSHDFFKAYPFVECNVYLSSGSKHHSQSCALE